jgi:hypothetical protein
MGDVKTNTTTSGPASPKVTETLNKLLGGVGEVYDAGPKVFDESLYTAPSGTTTNAWAMAKDAATNPAFAGGIGGAIDSYSKVARGDYLDNQDPLFQQALDRATNKTAADINASMGANGRYGSDVHVDAMTDAIGGMRTNAELDNLRYEQQRQGEAANMLPQLFGAAQLPSSVFGQVGAAQDADAAAQQQGAYDLFTRQNEAKADQLAKLSAILSGTAGAGGTTQSTVMPWWQAAIGLGTTAAGVLGR